MCNIIWEIIGDVLSLAGTIQAVLTVINIDFKDLSIRGSIERISHPEADAFLNRRYALNGIFLCVIGVLLNIITKFVELDLKISIIIGVVLVVSVLFVRYYLKLQYWFLIKEFDKYLIRHNKPSLLDCIKDGDKIRNTEIPIKFNVNRYIQRL